MFPCSRTALFLLVVVIAACAVRGDDRRVETVNLSKVVLQPEDLSAEWHIFDEGRQVIADRAYGQRSDPKRFGRVEGWKSRYRRADSQTTLGPLVIESRADLFESANGARQEFEALRADLPESLSGVSEVDSPQLGDASLAASLVQDAPNAVRVYLIAWRRANVAASLLMNGFEERFTLEQAVALARKQDQRIEKAAEPRS